jgi:hypothetical protein
LNRRPRRAGYGLIIALLQPIACSAPPDDPKAAIEALIARAEDAAQAGDIDALAATLDRDFRDASGRDRRAMVVLLRSLIGRYAALELVARDVDIEILSPQLANAQLTVLAVARDARRPLPAAFEADRRRLRLVLRGDGDVWRVIRAEWSVAGAD